MAAIIVKNLRKSFGNLRVIGDVSLEVGNGEIVCLLGPSGCGKTTLLRIIAKLIEPDEGIIEVNGTLGFVFQDPRLLYWKNVEKNLEIPYLLNGKKVNRDRIQKLLVSVGLSEFSDFYPNQLSLGMQQRVAIVRTLVLDPEILLLDEPFKSLDIKMRESLEDDVLLFIKKNSKSILFITHSIEESIRVADKIIVASKSPMELLGTIRMPCGAKPRDAYSPEFWDIERKIYDYLH
jgi:NitT/TauT family transport system ATP-binding protein